jgi:molecular chaperone HscA
VNEILLDIYEPGQTPLPHEADDVAVGIDLGTTNSVVAISQEGVVEVLKDGQGRSLLPSVVAYLDSGMMVGHEARRQLLDSPDRVVGSIKRLMGRGPEDVKRIAGTLPFDLDTNAEGGMVRLKIGERSLTPVEISADILRAIKTRAEEALNKEVKRAVVTVPAYFDDAARLATKDAARLAGLDVLRLVSEPTAAALAYGLDNEAEGLYAVYDLGGGTFDFSLLRMEKGVFQVLATGGDAALGGDDFDHLIAERFLAERDPQGLKKLSSGEVKQVMASARIAKECLTAWVEGDWMIDVEDRPTRHRLTREQFEEMITPQVAKTVDICRNVLLDADVLPGDIKGVVLVGGSTRVPLVRRRVEEFFGAPPLADINPDEVVAVGAARQAEALTAGSDTLLLDVIPLSLGLETMGGIVEKIVPRNTPIPVAMAQEFTTYQDGQTAMMIQVVQGEREMVVQNRSLARFVLGGIPPMTAGAARIRVAFNVDADGLLTVSAQEMTTGVEQQIQVKPSYGLTEDEMARMLKDSLEHARQDMEDRLLAESRVEAKRNMLAVQSALAVDKDLLSNEEFKDIEVVLNRVERSIEGVDREAISAAVVDLDAVTRPFAERRMDRGIRSALAGLSVDTLESKVES